MAVPSLFTQINQVWEGSDSIKTAVKPESVYMTTRYLSLDKRGFLAANDCNRMQGLPPWAALPFLKFASPNINAPRNKYPKKLVQEAKLSVKRKNALARVCAKFNVNQFHGLQIMGILESQGFKLETY